MIRNNQEYRTAVNSLEEQKAYMSALLLVLHEQKATDEEIEAAVEPIQLFMSNSQHEIDVYKRLRSGDASPVLELRDVGPAGVGRMLIYLRIYRRVSQRKLADALGVPESQVSRDERNEYHAVTSDRAERITDALGGMPKFADIGLKQSPPPVKPKARLDMRSYRETPMPEPTTKEPGNEPFGLAA